MGATVLRSALVTTRSFIASVQKFPGFLIIRPSSYQLSGELLNS